MLTAAARDLMQRGSASGAGVPKGWPSPSAGGTTTVASTRSCQAGPVPVGTKRAEPVRPGTFSLYGEGGKKTRENSSGYLRCA